MNLVTESNLITSGITSGQSGPSGCILAGTVEFNIAELAFEGGKVSFLLRDADIEIAVRHATIDYAAYKVRPEDGIKSKSVESQVEVQKREAKSDRKVGLDLAKAKPSGALRFNRSRSKANETKQTTQFTQTATTSRIAFGNRKHGGEWKLTGHVIKLRGRTVERGLFGEQLLAGDGARGRLLAITAARPDWDIRLLLRFEANDVYWWNFQIDSPVYSKLSALLKRQKDPRSFLFRIGLAKWLATRAEAHEFFCHRLQEERP
jgi:hypothetical protein